MTYLHVQSSKKTHHIMPFHHLIVSRKWRGTIRLRIVNFSNMIEYFESELMHKLKLYKILISEVCKTICTIISESRQSGKCTVYVIFLISSLCKKTCLWFIQTRLKIKVRYSLVKYQTLHEEILKDHLILRNYTGLYNIFLSFSFKMVIMKRS